VRHASVGWGNIQQPTSNAQHRTVRGRRIGERSFTSGMGSGASWGGGPSRTGVPLCEHSRAGGCHLSMALSYCMGKLRHERGRFCFWFSTRAGYIWSCELPFVPQFDPLTNGHRM